MNMRALHFQGLSKRSLLTLTIAAMVVGCAALTPQFHSPSIVSPSGQPESRPWERAPAASAPEKVLSNLSDALWSASTSQSQFTAAAQSLRNSKTGLNMTTLAAAVGGAGVAVTDPSPKKLGVIAAVITGLLGADTVFLPKERAKAFDDGARAVACAINGAIELKDDSLQSKIDAFDVRRSELSTDIGQLEAWSLPVKQIKTSGGPRGDCSSFQACQPPPPGISAAQLAGYQKDCSDLETQYAKRCAPATRTETILAVDPEVAAQLSLAKALNTTIIDRLKVAGDYVQASASQSVALELRTRVEQIADAVVVEAAKTQPDGAAVKAVLQASFPNVLAPAKPPAAASAPASSPGQALSSNAGRQQVGQGVNTLAGKDFADLQDMKRRFRQIESDWFKLDQSIQGAGLRVAHANALARCETRNLGRSAAASSPTGANP